MKNELKDVLRKSPAVFALIFVNAAVFVILSLLGDPSDAAFMLSCGAMSYPLVKAGEYWRIITAMFLHFDISHLAGNMLSLYAVGSIIETAFGRKKFLLIYFISGIAAGCTSCIYHSLLSDGSVCAGASGAVFGLSGALIILALFRQTAGYGIPAKRVLPAVILSVLLSAGLNTDNAAHIGGLAAGFLLAFLLIPKKQS